MMMAQRRLQRLRITVVRFHLVNQLWGAVMSAVTKPDWPMKRCGPEEYAPSNRRPAIHSENRSSNELAERMAALVGQVAGASLDQIDQVAGELEKTRNVMRSEAERVGRLINNYVRLSNSTVMAMKIISENLKPFQRPE